MLRTVYERESVKKTLIDKFRDAETVHDVISEGKRSVDSEVVEEMVLWQSAKRATFNPWNNLKLKISDLSCLKEKDINFKRRPDVSYESWAFKKVNKFFSNKDLSSFFAGQNDYCNLNILVENKSISVEAYRMIEVTSSYRESLSLELLKSLKKKLGSNFEIIRKDYGKNEKGINVLILGFHYKAKERARVGYINGRRA